MENNLKKLVEITREFTSSEEDIKEISNKIKSADGSLEEMIRSTKNFEEKIDLKIIDNLEESIEDTMKAILAVKKSLQKKSLVKVS